MPHKKKPSTRGGAGRGQGRKPGPLPVKLGIKVAKDVREYLSSLADGAISDQIDADIRASKGFKAWAKLQSEK